MAEENKPENTTKQTETAADPLGTKSAVELLNALTEARNQLLAASKHEEREDQRLALYRRQIELHADDIASVKAHRERSLVIDEQNAKHLASIAESLGAIAKAVLEEAKS